VTARVPRSTILSHTIIAGRSWGVHGRGRLYKMELSCGHVDYRHVSAGIPKSGTVECNDCVFAAMRAKVAAKHQ
jgi:hypothetical protein